MSCVFFWCSIHVNEAPNRLAQILKRLKTIANYRWTSLPIMTLWVTQQKQIYRLYVSSFLLWFVLIWYFFDYFFWRIFFTHFFWRNILRFFWWTFLTELLTYFFYDFFVLFFLWICWRICCRFFIFR